MSIKKYEGGRNYVDKTKSEMQYLADKSETRDDFCNYSKDIKNTKGAFICKKFL